MKAGLMTAVAALTMCVSGGAFAATIFEDDFGVGNSYNVEGWDELESSAGEVVQNNGRLRLRGNMAGSPDAAVASIDISTVGYENVSVSFDWQSRYANEEDDYLNFAWSVGSMPSMSDPSQWNIGIGSLADGGTDLHSASVNLGSLAANTTLYVMFYTDVSEDAEGAKEGFLIDNFVVSGDLIANNNNPNNSIAPVPLPAGLPLLAGALGIAGFVRGRSKAKRKA